MCLCVFLAFGATLSADTSLQLGNANLGTYTPTVLKGTQTVNGATEQVAPYPGTLTIGGVVQPYSLFICITGNEAASSTESGTVAAPSGQGQEEAAFLDSLLMTDAAADKISIGTTGSGSSKQVTLTQNGTMTTGTFINTVLGPVQVAIWDVMGTLPAGDTKIGTTNVTLNDAATLGFVAQATSAWTSYLNNPSNALTVALNKSFDVFNASSGQSFVFAATPEPGTMVLFGAGGLLLALGCGRKLLAKRRAS
jgi:hypothetical protein